MDLSVLRQELHRAIDVALDTYLGASRNGRSIEVSREGAVEGWSYRWPSGDVESYDRTTRYRVAGDFGEADVRVAHTLRYAWGRDRGRIVIFGKASGTSSAAYYPWTEFVETDDGEYGAKLSDPGDPRKSLRSGDQIPPRFEAANVQRNDQLFRSIRDGSALRFVVAADDVEAMIAHAYWVATLRGRL